MKIVLAKTELLMTEEIRNFYDIIGGSPNLGGKELLFHEVRDFLHFKPKVNATCFKEFLISVTEMTYVVSILSKNIFG